MAESSRSAQSETDISGKGVLMVIPITNFRDEELVTPKSIFEANGARVTVASTEVGEARGMLGAAAQVDVDVKSVKVATYDAILFVGGIGVEEHRLFDDEDFTRIAAEAYQQGKIVGAICLAPKILASSGILSGKEATVFSSGADYIQEKGAMYTGSPVTQSGNIITADGPTAATAFADTVVRAIKLRTKSV